jgi:hypothetical protein
MSRHDVRDPLEAWQRDVVLGLPLLSGLAGRVLAPLVGGHYPALSASSSVCRTPSRAPPFVATGLSSFCPFLSGLPGGVMAPLVGAHYPALSASSLVCRHRNPHGSASHHRSLLPGLPLQCNMDCRSTMSSSTAAVSSSTAAASSSAVGETGPRDHGPRDNQHSLEHLRCFILVEESFTVLSSLLGSHV